MMSKQDYELVARALAQTLDDYPQLLLVMPVVASRLADAFRQDNPNFSEERFAQAILNAPRKDGLSIIPPSFD